MQQEDFLIEIGCAELPPKALPQLSSAFHQAVATALADAQLHYQSITAFASPRRLALLISQLETQQPTQTIERKGPALSAAFDAEGNPSKAAEGFAKSCGVTLNDLIHEESEKGIVLVYRAHSPGKTSAELLPNIINTALKSLPIPKMMRWGNSDIEFIRPVQWIVLMQDHRVIPATILGLEASNITYGHRYHHPQGIIIKHANQYEAVLHDARVIAHFEKRKNLIRQEVNLVAEKNSAIAVIDAGLLDEVTAIVEWPVALLGHFDSKFLNVPEEALIASMHAHQKCFYCTNKNGELLPYFITVCNIQSLDENRVIQGNERVICARLSDAQFFYELDSKIPLDNFVEKLHDVTYLNKLGSLFDKTQRVCALTKIITELLGADPSVSLRAATLSRADLMSNMVGEFPELQGIMGYHYARLGGESQRVANAIREFYLPNFSGDAIPDSLEGSALALAERLDTLVGIFAINQQPTGMKDPYKCRRAAQGIVRIIIEKNLSLSLSSLLNDAYSQLGQNDNPTSAHEAHQFIIERLRALYLDRGVAPDSLQAVLSTQQDDLHDFDERLKAIIEFRKLDAADALAAANKRVKNILEKESLTTDNQIVIATQLVLREEIELYQHIKNIERDVATLINNKNYIDALRILANLQEPVDYFFEKVMVMVDDITIKNNRIALLKNLYNLFIGIADISLLQGKRAN